MTLPDLALPEGLIRWLDGPFWETDLIVGAVGLAMVGLLIVGAVRAAGETPGEPAATPTEAGDGDRTDPPLPAS